MSNVEFSAFEQAMRQTIATRSIAFLVSLGGVGAAYTCEGKGGEYALVGVSIGAGGSHGDLVVVYRDVESGRLFHRDALNFCERMKLVRSA